MLARAEVVRRRRLELEELEDRRLLSGMAPTVAEQVFLERLNDARSNPAAYGASIGVDLSGVAPSQPLAFDPLLIQAALGHSQDMNARNYFAHNTPEGVDPGARITASGFSWSSWGESIAAGATFYTPDDALRALIVDAGIPDLGHRRQLLAIDATFKPQEQAGIGIVQSGTGLYANYYTIDTASDFVSGPFITGVVYTDANSNGKYDGGEGLGNVTIHVTGTNAFGQPVDLTTTTYATGGYSVRLGSGAYTLTATGGGLTGSPVQAVTVGSTNVRLDFGPTYDTFITKLYETDLGRSPSGADLAYWSQVTRIAGPTLAANAIGMSTESCQRVVDNWYQTYLGRTAFGSPGIFEGQYWVNLLQGGMKEEQVLPIILASPEVYERSAHVLGLPSNTPSNDSLYIQALYKQLFTDHTPGPIELSYWLTQLPVIGRAGLANALLNSGEHRAVEVSALYADVLGRTSPPGLAEISYWVNSGIDLVSIRLGFESTPEFVNNP